MKNAKWLETMEIKEVATAELEKVARELRDECIARHKYTNEEIEEMGWQIEWIQQELDTR